ncbi:MAG: polysaccharide deacetylase family protein [Candidatus Omnitrophica bacterium]|nr:polysaccharide deacetylase family protein [Candidatus Omnitrophota bacterium]
MEKIPILLYHDCCPGKNGAVGGFDVTQEDFRSQMEYLHRNGFRALSLARLLAEREYFREEKTPDGRPLKPEEVTGDTRKKVVLTFDDGDKSNFDLVLPVLKEMGFSATFFVTVNEIGKEGRMDWEMIYELAKSGMDIGSHGMTHSFLTGHNDYTVLNELLLSKQVLEKYTRKRVDFLSIPHGFYNKKILTIARDVGFKAACVSDAGYNDFLDNQTFLLKRFPMRRGYRLNTFKSIVNGLPSLSVQALEKARTFLRHVLGYQVYDRFRRAMVK